MRVAIALFAVIELFLVYMVRDSLVLNVIQLIHPVEAIGDDGE